MANEHEVASMQALLRELARVQRERDEARAALVAVIAAWESLPGGQRYAARDVESWLIERMGPAVNAARAKVAR